MRFSFISPDLISAAVCGEPNAPGRLLQMCGVLGLQAKAGYLPPRLEDALPPPSPHETRRYCTATFAKKLNEVLGQYPQLLPEYLSYLIDHEQVMPPEWIPKVLHPRQTWIRRQWIDDLLALESIALGERAIWIAENGLPIKYALKQLTHPIRSVFSVFQRLRRADPTQARSYFETISDLQIQKNLLPAFYDGLSMADEPLLESCLDHPSTRGEAVDLLVRLPESRLITRNLIRLQAFVTPTSNPTWRLRFQLPTEYNEEMSHDGIEERQKGKPNAYWWLQQMFQRVPLIQWQAWGFEVDMWIETDPMAPVFQYFPGYLKALIMAQDAERLRQLIAKLSKQFPNGLLFEALATLTFAEQCSGIHSLATRNLSLGHILRSLYGRRIWTTAESALFIAQFQPSLYLQGLEDNLLNLALYLRPDLGDEVLTSFYERISQVDRRAVPAFRKLMNFRRQLHQRFFAE